MLTEKARTSCKPRGHPAVISTIIAGMFLAANAVAAEADKQQNFASFGGSVKLGTDYMFRGISNSNEEFQLRGDFNWTHASGFYAGIWASNTDFGGAGNSMEMDPYIGYANSIGDSGFSYDVGYFAYFYPGSEVDLDFGEFYAIGTWSAGAFRVSPSVWYADNYFGEDFLNNVSGLAYAVTVAMELPGGVDASARLGEQSFDSGASGLDYIYYDAGVSKALGDFSLALRWYDTDGVEPGLADPKLAEGRVVFSVTRSF